MRIGRATRKNVLDWLSVEGISWAGRLSDETFLDRFVDLDALPSTDPRFKSARSDIRQHRFNNDDWDNDWIYSYSPLGLLTAGDDVFLAFLTEMLHPVVRPDSDDARTLATELNDLLRQSGIELYQSGSIGARPVWATRTILDGRPIPGTSPAISSTPEALDRLWDRDCLRLFLSHLSSEKVAVSRLKRELYVLGASGFVAHEDIEPSLEWQGEIETALRTMDAMAALLTPGFSESKWTDQEVGFALGLGRPVVAVRCPTTPHGFIARVQGVRGDLTKPAELAGAIVDVLLKRPETGQSMREALVVALERSDSYASTKAVIAKIRLIDDLSEAQQQRLRRAIGANNQVGDYRAVSNLERYLDEHGASSADT